MEKETNIKKRDYVPLHERLQANEDNIKKSVIKKEEQQDMYRAVFETDAGQQLLEHLVNKYIAHVPAANSTPNEIMFLHGNSYVIHDILQQIKRG